MRIILTFTVNSSHEILRRTRSDTGCHKWGNCSCAEDHWSSVGIHTKTLIYISIRVDSISAPAFWQIWQKLTWEGELDELVSCLRNCHFFTSYRASNILLQSFRFHAWIEVLYFQHDLTGLHAYCGPRCSPWCAGEMHIVTNAWSIQSIREKNYKILGLLSQLHVSN